MLSLRLTGRCVGGSPGTIQKTEHNLAGREDQKGRKGDKVSLEGLADQPWLNLGGDGKAGKGDITRELRST